MSAVIEFPADRVSARPLPARKHKAEVLLFTGVQVERRDVARPQERKKPVRSATAQAAADPS